MKNNSSSIPLSWKRWGITFGFICLHLLLLCTLLLLQVSEWRYRPLEIWFKMHLSLYARACMHMCAYMCSRVHMHAYAHVCVCMFVYAYAHVCARVCTHAHTRAYGVGVGSFLHVNSSLIRKRSNSTCHTSHGALKYNFLRNVR